jgi:uncharacterized protein with von Willebrand factor type A (vWA) domain
MANQGSYRYGPYHDGPDPLAPPFDVRTALDEMSDGILGGAAPDEALRDALRRGLGDRQGLDNLMRRVRDRLREVRERGRAHGLLEQARALLDTAIGQERAELFPDPSDEARMAEAELDALPSETAQAIRALSSYQWRSDAARETFDRLKDLLRREVLDSQFRGMRDALARPDPAAMQRVKDMMSDLSRMLEADARGEHLRQDFAEFMAKYRDFFPENPGNLDELVDSLMRRMNAASRVLDSLSPEQRAELAAMMEQAMADAGLAAEMARLAGALRARRPDMDATPGGRRDMLTGDEPLGLADATTAIEELADLAELDTTLRQDYPGARLDDIDEAAVRRALGRRAVDDLENLRRIERELERQGYLRRSGGNLELTPKAVRRLGDTALRRVFAELSEAGSGDHDQHDAGHAGEPTGSTRQWEFGDEQPIDVSATVRNAVLRSAAGGRPRATEQTAATEPAGATESAGPVDADRTAKGAAHVTLSVDDFEVTETERRSAAAVCLLVDLSYSMALRGTWGVAKQTALALHSLIRTRFPLDAVQIVGFSNYARELRETELAGLGWDMVQGTNLHHALLIAGRHLDKHPEHEPVVLIVTDGEPTAHLLRNGRPYFDWPPAPETLELTLAEVDKMTRRRAVLNIFMLAEDERLTAFVEEVARRNGGRLFRPEPQRLGEYVVADFLRTRRRGTVRR